MVTEDEETRQSITETIAQLAANYKTSQNKSERTRAEKDAKEFIKSVAKGKDELKEYTDMYKEMKG